MPRDLTQVLSQTRDSEQRRRKSPRGGATRRNELPVDPALPVLPGVAFFFDNRTGAARVCAYYPKSSLRAEFVGVRHPSQRPSNALPVSAPAPRVSRDARGRLTVRVSRPVSRDRARGSRPPRGMLGDGARTRHCTGPGLTRGAGAASWTRDWHRKGRGGRRRHRRRERNLELQQGTLPFVEGGPVA